MKENLVPVPECLASPPTSTRPRLNPNTSVTKQSSIADLQSKNPADCRSEFCSIHKFINETIDTIIDPGAKNNNISEDIGFANRQAWKTAQNSNQACSVAKQLLTSGKPPPKATGKNTGEYWNDVRTYCREATIAKDGLLVVKNKPELLSGNVLRERIVVPKPLVPALLYHLHIISAEVKLSETVLCNSS